MLESQAISEFLHSYRRLQVVGHCEMLSYIAGTGPLETFKVGTSVVLQPTTHSLYGIVIRSAEGTTTLDGTCMRIPAAISRRTGDRW
jgi:hypothetical protein